MKDKEIRNCTHDFLFATKTVDPEDINPEIAHEIKNIFCCNYCGGYMVVQEVSQGECMWIAYPSEYPQIYE